MKPIFDYYDLRRKQYEEVYGDLRFHDDLDYLSPKEEKQVGETPKEVIFFLFFLKNQKKLLV